MFANYIVNIVVSRASELTPSMWGNFSFSATIRLLFFWEIVFILHKFGFIFWKHRWISRISEKEIHLHNLLYETVSGKLFTHKQQYCQGPYQFPWLFWLLATLIVLCISLGLSAESNAYTFTYKQKKNFMRLTNSFFLPEIFKTPYKDTT